METRPIYHRESESARLPEIILSDEQKDRIRNITLGVEEVAPIVREMAAEDVLKTLENGHPLNRLLTDTEGRLIGYIACEDFIPHEAYIKYVATTGGTGRNLLREIPAFLEYAQSQGYTKINFHGWNDRLNHVMERYGFQRLRTDRMGELAADFYERALTPAKTSAQVERERIAAFEQKYLVHLQREYEKTLATFSQKEKEGRVERREKERAIAQAFEALSRRLSVVEGLDFGDRQQAVLKLKLARYFQGHETIDENTLFDALVESPKFLATDKGSLHRLFETHEEKTLQKIAEIRKRKAEQRGDEGANPYEALFTTTSGNYYLARLLNMPHLEEESAYMGHCVGTSDSYINRMKRGDVEILSLRTMPRIDPATGEERVEDSPVMTIEYDVKSGVIQQMKKQNDEYLSPNDPIYPDVIDALRQLASTETDMGKPRTIKKINPSETRNFPVQDGHILTDRGEVSLKDFDPDEGRFVWKIGRLDVLPETPREDIAKLIKIVDGPDVAPEQIARTLKEVTEQTQVYAGPLVTLDEHGEIMPIFQLLPDSIEHIYPSLPEGEVHRFALEIGGKSKEELKALVRQGGHQFGGSAEFMMDSEAFTTLPNPEEANLVRLTVADLGFPDGATTQEIFDRAVNLGLEFCPPEVGPYYRISYTDQPMDKWVRIGMNPIADPGRYPHFFSVGRCADGSWLGYDWAFPDDPWNPDRQLVFRLRKRDLKP